MANRINPARLKSTIAALKARFETGTIHSMKDLTGMYVTGMIAAIGMGYDGFVSKCNSPEKFVIEDLLKLADVIEVDISLIMKVVMKQASKNVMKKDISHLLKDKD
ncbi:hypothetical protein WG904_19365 [Pedobacter sp. Du54]|uniref:hypothetical protein n=1 Tax=Pedobacter anseongensis TaxID=3133439 RepID=UPI0030AC5F12